jgi:ABC-type nitrate/sulfonate/bicarbonate transport system permease component
MKTQPTAPDLQNHRTPSHQPIALILFTAKARFITAVLLMALWWGGFSFYSAVVVPTGHLVLRSKIRQGMITQRVTNVLNGLAGVALVAFLWELYSRRQQRKVNHSWTVGLMCALLLGLSLALLCWLHTLLDLLLDPVARSVSDDDKFYFTHRIYLIIATIQWLAGLVSLSWLAALRNP